MALKLKPCFGSLALQESSVIFRSYSESAVAINNSVNSLPMWDEMVAFA